MINAEELSNKVRFHGMTDGEREIVLRYFRQEKEFTIQEIAWRLNTSVQVVHYWLKKLGIQNGKGASK